MSISIIIPNYNGEELLKKNLPIVFESLSGILMQDSEVIVVDDLSSDKSLDVLDQFQEKYNNLKIIRNDKNFGFSSTVNKGVAHAKGDIIILLNTDVSPQKDFIFPLIGHFKDDKVFAVGCLDKSIEGEKIVLRGRGLGKWERGFLVHRRGEIDKTNTLWVSAGSGAFRKEIWDKLGGLNELYNPFYWEDIDLSYRALKSGFKIIFEAKSIVTHEHSKGAIKTKYSSSWVKTIAYRNQFIFVWENATDYWLQISHFFWLPYHFIKALLRFDLNFFLGFFNAFILLPKVIKSSFKYQKIFVKRDFDIIANYK
jgi:GT2 family glycosyltransferase